MSLQKPHQSRDFAEEYLWDESNTNSNITSTSTINNRLGNYNCVLDECLSDAENMEADFLMDPIPTKDRYAEKVKTGGIGNPNNPAVPCPQDRTYSGCLQTPQNTDPTQTYCVKNRRDCPLSA